MGNRNVVPTENATNLKDSKGSSETVFLEVDTTRSLIYRKRQTKFFDINQRKKAGTFCDNWNDRIITHQGKTARKYINGLTE